MDNRLQKGNTCIKTRKFDDNQMLMEFVFEELIVALLMINFIFPLLCIAYMRWLKTTFYTYLNYQWFPRVTKQLFHVLGEFLKWKLDHCTITHLLKLNVQNNKL